MQCLISPIISIINLQDDLDSHYPNNVTGIFGHISMYGRNFGILYDENYVM